MTTTFEQQREIQARQDQIEEMKRFRIRPSNIFIRRTRELAGANAQNNLHREGIEIKIQRALDAAA